jgi:hypothetical protein
MRLLCVSCVHARGGLSVASGSTRGCRRRRFAAVSHRHTRYVTLHTSHRTYLRELRDYQQQIKLFDESAEEIVRDAMRKQVRHLCERRVSCA